MLINETGRALDHFLVCYRDYLQSKYEVQQMSTQEIFDEFSENISKKEDDLKFLKPSE